MITSFYTEEDLKTLGFRSLGTNVLISRKASLYSPETIVIGNNVRIDDFCILSGNIKLGSHIHISAYSALYGGGGIEMEDYTGLSPRCTILSATDDFSGHALVGPCVQKDYRNITYGKVLIKKYSQIGTNTTVLPGVEIGEGVAVGAMSLVTKSLPCWSICYGIPARFVKNRSKKMLSIEL